ncbi:hypothetical protein SAMN05444714_0938 [Yoonia litorea]|uniref:Secreted protein n=2 Tax=Yoonia litorea TaxID=1123755 RepID=A0A1I6LVL3_9RHOB|nr:hypothetical protein SAMN05444714_0938 [Yoonia litorea]
MRVLFAVLSFLGFFSAQHAVAEDGPVVVELYTSQGCSSCPPADALLHDLAAREDVIALALHVDYWDYIGWKDIFGRPENTQRQHGYARAANERIVYTPQMVINGQDHLVGSRTGEVMGAVERHLALGQVFDVSVVRQGNTVTIGADPGPRGQYEVQIVRYLPKATVDIRRGENAGRTISYANIVTAWDAVAQWDGRQALRLRATISGDEPVVVLLQSVGHGPIVGAAQLR